jgi:hypothetical protein
LIPKNDDLPRDVLTINLAKLLVNAGRRNGLMLINMI